MKRLKFLFAALFAIEMLLISTIARADDIVATDIKRGAHLLLRCGASSPFDEFYACINAIEKLTVNSDNGVLLGVHFTAWVTYFMREKVLGDKNDKLARSLIVYYEDMARDLSKRLKLSDADVCSILKINCNSLLADDKN